MPMLLTRGLSEPRVEPFQRLVAVVEIGSVPETPWTSHHAGRTRVAVLIALVARDYHLSTFTGTQSQSRSVTY